MDSTGDATDQGPGWLVEHRYRAVMEVLDGSPVSEVAVRYGVSRQSVYTWRDKYKEGGIDARRIAFEAAQRRADPAPSRATVHRVPQEQRHKRKYKRWQRETPMALWQLDLVGGIYLADGRECKILSGIDDRSRFVVSSAVLAVPSGRAVADAFTAAMKRYGVPSEVLTDNGKQFTGRFTALQPRLRNRPAPTPDKDSQPREAQLRPA